MQQAHEVRDSEAVINSCSPNINPGTLYGHEYYVRI